MTANSDSNSYPMVHPLTFIQNPLIARLARDPYWTVSDDDKRPINARLLLDTGELRGARFDKDPSPLVTLAELDHDPNLQAVNRAYRLRARENRVIAIDVEPTAPDDIKNSILTFPAHYTELSKNGGVHVLICVPSDLITPENDYLFKELSVFKEPVPKDDRGKENRAAYFEVLFNDHFVTFTKRMLTKKPCTFYNQDPVAKERLTRFLENVVRLDAVKKQERELAKAYRINLMKTIISPEKEKDVRTFIALEPLDDARDAASEKKLSDFGGDESRYEMSVANGLAFNMLRVYDLARNTQSFHELTNALNDQNLVYGVYLMLKETVPYRDKHDETRENLPWLLFTAKRAYEFVKAQNAKRQKEKHNKK